MAAWPLELPEWAITAEEAPNVPIARPYPVTARHAVYPVKSSASIAALELRNPAPEALGHKSIPGRSNMEIKLSHFTVSPILYGVCPAQDTAPFQLLPGLSVFDCEPADIMVAPMIVLKRILRRIALRISDDRSYMGFLLQSHLFDYSTMVAEAAVEKNAGAFVAAPLPVAFPAPDFDVLMNAALLNKADSSSRTVSALHTIKSGLDLRKDAVCRVSEMLVNGRPGQAARITKKNIAELLSCDVAAMDSFLRHRILFKERIIMIQTLKRRSGREYVQ